MDYSMLIEALNYGSRQKGTGNIDGMVTIDNLFPELADPEKWNEIREKAEYRKVIDEVYQKAEHYQQKALSELPYSYFKLFHETGSRREYEEVYFDRRGRLSTFAVLSFLEPKNTGFLHELEDTLWAICNEYTWALPAHISEEDYYTGGNLDKESGEKHLDKKINFRPQISSKHRKTIDLFAAETAFYLAELTAFFEDRLSPLLYQRVKEEIYDRVIGPFSDLSNFFHWESLAMNWAAVCSGSVGAAAIYLIDNNQILAGIINRVMDAMDVFLSGFPDDGICQEGLDYCNYGFGFYTYFAELLKQRTAGRIDLMDKPIVREVALFQQRAYLSGDKVISFSDTPRQVRFHPGLTTRLSELVPEFELPDISFRAGFNDDHCYRWAHIIRDLVWFTSDASNRLKSDIPNFIQYFKDSQWLISRLDFNKEIVFAAKGGNNDEPHNHNDIGSFIYHINDTTYLIDPGSGEYSKEYFGPKRYSILCNGSQGHSLPIIEGNYQKAGRDSSSELIIFDDKDKYLNYTLEMAGAYDNKNLLSLRRKFRLNKSNGQLILEDEYKFKDIPASLTERLVSQLKPDSSDTGQIELVGPDSYILIEYNENNIRYSCKIEKFINHAGDEETLYLLDFSPYKMEKNFSIRLKIIPYQVKKRY